MSSFIPQFFLFTISVFVLLYLPAEFLMTIGNIRIKGWRRLNVGITIGVMIFLILASILAFVSLRQIVLPLLLLLSLISITKLNFWKKLLLNHWYGPHTILILFVLLYSISVITSGWIIPEGLLLKGVNGQDGIWNLALIRELKVSYPPQHPAFSSIQLKGYHFYYNFLVAEFSRITGLGVIHLHFHFISILMAFLLVYSIYDIAHRLSQNTYCAIWSTFFALAGGSFAYLLPLIVKQGFSLDDAFGIMQPMSLMVSPSFTLSLIVILCTLILLDEYLANPFWFMRFIIAVVAGIAIGIKVYAGILILPALAFLGVRRIITHRQWDLLFIFAISLFISLLIFIPFNVQYGFLVYQFLWPTHRLMEGNFRFTNWELKRQTMIQFGSFFGQTKLEIIAFVIFLFGNLGTRVLGILGLKLKHIGRIHLVVWMICVILLISFILPLFFIQPLGTFNTIQFFWYFLVFAGILSGWGVANLLSQVPYRLRKVCVLFLIIFTIPSAVEKLNMYWVNRSVIPIAEYELYRKLASIGTYSNTVLEIPTLPGYSKSQLEEWFYFHSLPKISALGDKRTMIGNEVVQFPYHEWLDDRINLISNFMTYGEASATSYQALEKARVFLQRMNKKYSIRYIVTTIKNPWFEQQLWVEKKFINDYGQIYEVLSL